MQPLIISPDLQAQAFPVLTPAQIDRIRPYGTARTVRAGEILFEPGKLGMPCFVVLSGKLEILMTTLSGLWRTRCPILQSTSPMKLA